MKPQASAINELKPMLGLEVTATPRLLEITDALFEAGIPFLIMGGHAVRHYGVDRNTLDFDFHVPPPRRWRNARKASKSAGTKQNEDLACEQTNWLLQVGHDNDGSV